ncbi:MAG: trigger factor family protein, partial [Chloroflexia bacterium]|nr:trigger factor family protein [Chloroflexia bacterium]
MARLEIEVEAEQINRETERAYKRLANRVVIPGFRRGKAPRV